MAVVPISSARARQNLQPVTSIEVDADERSGTVRVPHAMPRLPVSATIITLNEASRLEACLESLRPLVDQIVVVDSGSTDRTRQIALQNGAEVHMNDWPGYGPQKRHAEDLCRYDWILSIDADERITPELARELRVLFANGEPPVDACRLRIVDQFPHEEAPARWAYAYRRVRLYDRRRGRFAASLVHDDVALDHEARVKNLSGALSHVSFECLSSATEKLNRYTDLQIRDMEERGRRIASWRLLTEFPVAFLKSYVLRRRALYGWWGVVHSMNYAHSRFLRVAKAYERQSLRTEGEN